MENTLMLAWHKLNDQLKAFITKKIQNEEMAKDIVQDVFIKAYDNIGKLKDQQKINSWIFQITRNSINDYFRNQKKSFQDLPAEEPIAISFSKNETLELSKCMLPMIDLLPEKYQEAVKLADIDGLSQKQLAEQLHISYSGAKSRVQRGREKLKELYLQCCVISTDNYGNVIEYHERKCTNNCS